ncbi:hypothetical protein [Nocardioides sp.]|uniref:hypothetical protein n=1 Tax=Nocardioides sp. TaxID=35761 RepID=UPI002B9F3679|nr:hypothetical protein [Nocardioides sp.]HXH77332.1 hypothetical protein [Nocardioides sp.]
MTTTQGTEPTQVRQPRRATMRTIFQVGIPAILALPLIIQVIVDELGGQLPPGVTAWLVAVGAVITAIAAVLARVMAIPQVELLLRRLPDWTLLAAQPRPKPSPDENGRASSGLLLVLSLVALVMVLRWVLT